MKIELIWVGKTKENYVKDGVEIFMNRIKHFSDFSIVEIPDIKNPKNYKPEQLKVKEGEQILKHTNGNTFILLDEKGKSFSSVLFAKYLENFEIRSTRKIQFVIGGAFGFSKEVYSKANGKISLSAMTFSHQMIRLFFVEQIYRAYSILNNLPYHNE